MIEEQDTKEDCKGCLLFKKRNDVNNELSHVCALRLDKLHAHCPCKECLVKATCIQHYTCSTRTDFVNGKIRKRREIASLGLWLPSQ